MEKCAGLLAGLHGSPTTFHLSICGNAIGIWTRVQIFLKNIENVLEQFLEHFTNYFEKNFKVTECGIQRSTPSLRPQHCMPAVGPKCVPSKFSHFSLLPCKFFHFSFLEVTMTFDKKPKKIRSTISHLSDSDRCDISF